MVCRELCNDTIDRAGEHILGGFHEPFPRAGGGPKPGRARRSNLGPRLSMETPFVARGKGSLIQLPHR